MLKIATDKIRTSTTGNRRKLYIELWRTDTVTGLKSIRKYQILKQDDLILYTRLSKYLIQAKVKLHLTYNKKKCQNSAHEVTAYPVARPAQEDGPAA